MQKSQKGFTLIELVVVIVLLGILGVTALAKFQNLSIAATNAANSGIASEMSAASSINYAAALTNTAGSIDISDTTGGANVDCPTLAPQLFTSGAIPAGYDVIDIGTPACTAAGVTFQCDIGNTAAGIADTHGTATIICTGG